MQPPTMMYASNSGGASKADLEAKFLGVQVKDEDADAADGLCSTWTKSFSNWRNRLFLTIVDYNDLSRRSTRTPPGSREIPRRRFPPTQTSSAAHECSGKKSHYFVDTVVEDELRPEK
jgi:hypothetical protein